MDSRERHEDLLLDLGQAIIDVMNSHKVHHLDIQGCFNKGLEDFLNDQRNCNSSVEILAEFSDYTDDLEMEVDYEYRIRNAR